MHTACGSGMKGGGGTQNSHNNLILMQSKRNYHLVYGNQPVGGSIVAVVGQQVIVQLPEDVERDATVGRRHTVVGFQQHGLKISQHQVFPQQLVRQAIALQQHFQLLQELQHQW